MKLKIIVIKSKIFNLLVLKENLLFLSILIKFFWLFDWNISCYKINFLLNDIQENQIELINDYLHPKIICIFLFELLEEEIDKFNFLIFRNYFIQFFSNFDFQMLILYILTELGHLFFVLYAFWFHFFSWFPLNPVTILSSWLNDFWIKIISKMISAVFCCSII
jgi:hypothetical protein